MSLTNWQKTFYHCKAIKNENGEIIGYGKPSQRRENYQPLSGYAKGIEHGSSQSRYWRMFVTMDKADTYFIDDKLYLDGAIPTVGEDNGASANARITAVLPQNMRIRIEIEETP